MCDRRDNGNVIEIIGGDGPFDNHQISVTGHELIYDGIQSPRSGNEPPCMETKNQSMEIGQMFFQTQSFGSSSFMVENQRSCKDRPCKNIYTEVGCLYGDQCGFLHDEQSRIRERNSILLSSQIQSSVGYGDEGGNGNRGTAVNGGQVVANATVRPASWRTKICNKWESAGYCPFGVRCTYAHGAAELQRYGGGFLHQEANPNNQQLMNPNIVPPPGSSVAHVVEPSSSSVAPAGGSGQLSSTVRKPWKGPTKINRIYGDWIDDL